MGCKDFASFSEEEQEQESRTLQFYFTDTSLTSGKFAMKWKLSRVMAWLKSHGLDRTDTSSYWPVSVHYSIPFIKIGEGCIIEIFCIFS